MCVCGTRYRRIYDTSGRSINGQGQVRSLLRQAANYRCGSDGVIIRLRVDLGKGIKIREQGHDLQKSWHDHGFDSAWAPAGAIGQLEENCVFDPKRITILGLA